MPPKFKSEHRNSFVSLFVMLSIFFLEEFLLECTLRARRKSG